jgi:hypothetical protein
LRPTGRVKAFVKHPATQLATGLILLISGGWEVVLDFLSAEHSFRLGFMMLVHHDDAKREYAYGAEAKLGTFSDALMVEANKNGWTVLSMKNDWNRIFAFESE